MPKSRTRRRRVLCAVSAVCVRGQNNPFACEHCHWRCFATLRVDGAVACLNRGNPKPPFLSDQKGRGAHMKKAGESVRFALRRFAASARVEVSVAEDLRSTTAIHSFVHCANPHS